jgi:protocatechuate 3,4-dioxygenase beta subunit
MHDSAGSDDAPVGRVLTRRETIVLLGGAGAGGLLWLAGCSRAADTPASKGRRSTGASLDCAVKPELTEGPYYVDEGLTRADIRADSKTGGVQEGALLALTFNVSHIASGVCSPLPGAVVDVWHCNALGVYSDARDPGFNTIGQDWLRGNLTTNTKGVAAFTTIFPGWYEGRAVHIHFKIRSPASATSAYEFTSQLFFDEDFVSKIYRTEPYSAKGSDGWLRNANDRIYNQGGSELLLLPASSAEGDSVTLDIGLDVES